VTLIAKETRALAPVGVACAGIILTGIALDANALRGLGLAVYWFGASALGALAVGHEYNHRTLAMMLAQPVRRERVLVVKATVLAALLTLLFGAVRLAQLAGASDAWFGADEFNGLVLSWPISWAFFVAPFMTMVTRNPLAGALFTMSLQGVFFASAQFIADWRGLSQGEADVLRAQFFWTGTVLCCGVGAVLSPLAFLRLQALEGGGREFVFPRWRTQPSDGLNVERAPQHPVWMLIKKELRLQRMALTVTAIYVTIWFIAAFVSERIRPHEAEEAGAILTILNGVVTALLAGSLASASERQLNTFDSQAMLPTTRKLQWTVKVMTTLALVFVLGFTLPLLIAPATGWLLGLAIPLDLLPQTALAIVVLTTYAVYVSSLAANSLHALMIAAGFIPLFLLFVRVVLTPLNEWVFALMHNRLPFSIPGRLVGEFTLPIPFALAMAALFVIFGFANHRNGQRDLSRIGKQAAVLLACCAAFVVVWSAVASNTR
jgi:uncharacterized membrane protein YeaQ/YmgE (transglycosylase-associated protein family)